ncbi:hypothetical protein HHI36_021039 [Cryptolaemus montrouzieri]|uniref:Uncharacterized protein n=1 Tax=Cryptolaemus montrouzieri TaxID=559131 RepID=A0ABD2MWG7_9CUCU
MEFSNILISIPDESIELEDKSFVHQFIDAEGKIWERNNFFENHDGNEQTNNTYIASPKMKPDQSEDNVKEEEVGIGGNSTDILKVELYEKVKVFYIKLKLTNVSIVIIKQLINIILMII